MRKNLFVSNPFVIFTVLWLFVLLLYKLEWSDLYPKLSDGLTLFMLSTITFSLSLAFVTWKRKTFEFRFIDNPEPFYLKLKKIAKYNFILMLLDILYSGYIPLLVYLNGPASGSTYLEYGMPFIHIVVVNGFSLIFSCSFWLYKNSNTTKLKKACLKICGICAIQPVLCFSRAQLMLMLLSALYIILVSSKNVKKNVLKLSASALLILYLFGLGEPVLKLQ